MNSAEPPDPHRPKAKSLDDKLKTKQTTDPESSQDAKGLQHLEKRKRLLRSLLLFLLLLILILVLHRCYEDAHPPELPGLGINPVDTSTSDTNFIAPANSIPLKLDSAQPTIEKVPGKRPPPDSITSSPKKILPLTQSQKTDSFYVVADPWGGRHFDSVEVRLECSDSCLVLYSTTDSINLKTYDKPIKILRNTSLWFTGQDAKGQRLKIVRTDYIIERDPGICPDNMLPLETELKTICIDVYEWPNREGAYPQSSVTQAEANDSCESLGKRLCSQKEWGLACEGPDQKKYPYGNQYNEKACSTQENEARRSGRSPMCRSYFGIHDQSGNLWEWTASPAPRSGLFLVAGGNWSTGDQATCDLSKFSFYPQNKYAFVGFRCCQDVKEK